jgi:hypothetical protein
MTCLPLNGGAAPCSPDNQQALLVRFYRDNGAGFISGFVIAAVAGAFYSLHAATRIPPALLAQLAAVGALVILHPLLLVWWAAGKLLLRLQLVVTCLMMPVFARVNGNYHPTRLLPLSIPIILACE